MTVLHKTVTYLLFSNSLYWLLNFYTFKQAAILEEPIWQRTEGNLQPTANKKLTPNVLEPQGPSLPTEVDPSLVKPQMRPQSWLTQELQPVRP